MGCRFEEPVTFRKIDKVKVESIEDGIVNISAEAEFYNPNELGGKLKKVDINVSIGETKLARVFQVSPQKIEAQSNFSVPIQLQFALEDAQQGLLHNLLAIVTSDKVKLHFLGEIRVSTWGFSQRVPVDYYEEVRL